MVDIQKGQVWKMNGPDKYVMIRCVDDNSVVVQKCSHDGMLRDSMRFLREISIARLRQRYILIRQPKPESS